jgi:trimeric autotransporter adhesin
VGNLVNQHVRFIESGEFLTYPKPTGGNSLDRLIERKQMSTKTTFKRIALVAVAALGFGVLTSVAPATAVPRTATLVTVGTVPVAQVGVTHTTPVTFTAPFAATTDTHIITVRVISAPTGSVYSGTLGTAKITNGNVGTSWINGTVYAGNGGTTVPGDIDIASTGTAAANGVVSALATNTTYPAASALLSHSSWVTPDTTSAAAVSIMPDVAGSYTVLVSTSPRTLAGTEAYAAGDASATYTFSTGASVASVTLAAVTGSPIGGSTNGQIFKVTIKDAAGSVTQLSAGQAINITSNVTTTNIGEITAGCTSSCTASYNGAGVTAGLDSSNFSAGVAYIQIKDATTAAADAVITATGSGLLSNAITSTVGFSTVLGTAFATSAIADVALAVRPGSGKKGVTTVTAGTSYTDQVSTSVTSHSYAVTVATAPTAAAKVAVNITDTAGQITGLVGAVYSTYIGVAATTGLGTLSVTTAAMLNSYAFTASVASTTAAAIVVTAATSSTSASTMSVEPNSVIKAAHGASSVLSAVLNDQFGAANANAVVTVTTTGRNASVTGTTLATDANGRVTYTRTDAGTSATTNKQDIVTFTPASGSAATVTINYVDSGLGITTVTLVTPTSDDTAATGVTYSDINASSTAGVQATTQTITATVKDVNGTLLVGIPVTFSTADAGAAVLSTSVTVYTGADGTAATSVYGWSAGVKTFTATAGAVSATGTVAYRQGGATGTDNPTEVRTIEAVATGNTIVVTAKDRLGNVVSGVPLWGTRTGNGTFGGGSNTNGQTTGVNGTAEFLFNAGSEDSVVTITAGSATATPLPCYGQTGNLAGMNVCSTAATQTAYTATTVGTATTAETGVGASFAPAGVGSVTVAVAAGIDNAQVAADAAAEATDAANAATDAANAAAEAADAATAAAQDAADAVAALSTEVTALISALRKQITSLTNLVIKIQKKVKA